MDVWYNYDDHLPGPLPHTRASDRALVEHQMQLSNRHPHPNDFAMHSNGAHFGNWSMAGTAHHPMPRHNSGPADDHHELTQAPSYHCDHLNGAAEALANDYRQQAEAYASSGRFPDVGSSSVPIHCSGHGPSQLPWDAGHGGLQQPSPPSNPLFLPTIMERAAHRRSAGASSVSSQRFSHASGSAPQYGHSAAPFLPSSASAHSLHTQPFQNAAQPPCTPAGSRMPPSGRWSFSGSEGPVSGKQDSAACRPPAADFTTASSSGHTARQDSQRSHQGECRSGQVSDMARYALGPQVLGTPCVHCALASSTGRSL